MKEYTYDVTFTVSATVTVEAENEDAAAEAALDEVADMKICEPKELASEAELQKVEERCDYCYERFDVDITPLVSYNGMRLCSDCKEELENADKDD